MDIETVMQSEVRKRKANITYSYIYMESRKIILMNLFEGQQRRHRPREQTYGQAQ